MSEQQVFNFELDPGYGCFFGQNSRTLRVIIFSKNSKLRSHAVSHIMDSSEKKDWEKILGHSIAPIINECHRALLDIGCPFAKLGTRRAPCSEGVGFCSLFNQCSEIVSKIESAYVQAIARVIESSVRMPRFATFYDKQEDHHCWMIPEVPLVAKMAWLDQKNCFNVMTCYRPQGTYCKASEAVDLTKREISAEKSGVVHWCTRETWALAETLDEPVPVDSESKLRCKKKRHFAGNLKGNWRKWVDEYA
jgi:hypothetical protein